MGIIRILICLAAIVLPVTGCTTGVEINARYEKELLRKDFRQFRNHIEKESAFLFADIEMIDELLDETEKQIKDTMSELEFYRLLNPVVARLRCGHSFLSVSKSFQQNMAESVKYFPLSVRISDDKLFVIEDRSTEKISCGAQIMSINQIDSRTIIKKIMSNMSSDGDDVSRHRYDAERHFASMYYLFVDESQAFTVELLDDESLYEVTLDGISDATLAKTPMTIMFDTASSPWSLRIDDTYAHAVIPTFAMDDVRRFERELKIFFKTVKERKTGSLIVDLRGNYGGSVRPVVTLFSYLIDRPLRFFSNDNPFYLFRWKREIKKADYAFDGDLYVLMDEGCFSMTGFLLSLLKEHDIGTLYGVKSSGGNKCSDASRNRVLRNTGLRLRYSTDIFQSAVESIPQGEGVQSDIVVNMTIADYLSLNDPVLNAVLERIGSD
ncbi:MAG: S41 family peptidase [Sphaerochaetaceae bacterium]